MAGRFALSTLPCTAGGRSRSPSLPLVLVPGSRLRLARGQACGDPVLFAFGPGFPLAREWAEGSSGDEPAGL